MWNTFIGVWTLALNTVETTFSDVIDDLTTLFNQVWNYINNTFDLVIGAIAGELVSLVNMLEAALLEAESQINDVLTDICHACNDIPCCKVTLHYIGGGSCSGEGKCLRRSDDGLGFADVANVSHAERTARHALRSSSSNHTFAPTKLRANLGAIRDLGFGNLTIDSGSLCASVLGSGFDAYEFYHMSHLDKISVVLCLGWIEYTQYYDQVLATQLAAVASGARKRSLDTTTGAGKLLAQLRDTTDRLVAAGENAKVVLRAAVNNTRAMRFDTRIRARHC